MKQQKFTLDELLKMTTELLRKSQQRLLDLESQQPPKEIKKKKKEETPNEQYRRYVSDPRTKLFTLSEAVDLIGDISADDYIVKQLSALLSLAKRKFNGDNLFYYDIEFFVPLQKYQKIKRIGSCYFFWDNSEDHHKRTAAMIAQKKVPAFPFGWVSYDHVVKMAMTPGIDADYQRRALLSLIAAKKKVARRKEKEAREGINIAEYQFLIRTKGRFLSSFEHG